MKRAHKVVIQVQQKVGTVHADFANGAPFDGRIRPLVDQLEDGQLTLADVRVQDLEGAFNTAQPSRQARLVIDILLSSRLQSSGISRAALLA